METKVYEEDYRPNPDIDDDEMLHIKTAVSKLNTIQRLIFFQYCEIGSYAGLARLYGVSTPTAKKYIEEIRQKIYDNL